MTPSSDPTKTMPAVETMRASAVPLPSFQPIIERTSHLPKREGAIKFEASKHLEFSPPSRVVTMKEIGYKEDAGVSPVAVSEPFKLFSREAIQQMRAEIMQPEVMEKCKFKSNIAASQLRGYAPKYAPFTYKAWTDPKTLEIISNIAGVDLVPEMDYEIGHINFSVKSDQETKQELALINKQKRAYEEDEGISCPWEDDKPVVGWHTDSYPFVCVLMLSDCTDMVGGETALLSANGEVIKVRGPQEGCAVILQGRYITHQALRALGAKERITSVTSFRPRSAFVKDDSVLATVRPISSLPDLYQQFFGYRLEILEKLVGRMRAEYDFVSKTGAKFDTEHFKGRLVEAQRCIQHTNDEMVPESMVRKGYIEEMNIPNAIVAHPEETRSAKRQRTE